MGQYWIPVNLDKKEYIEPHDLGCGLKLWEQLASRPGTGTALVLLCAAMPEMRGGGDLDLEEIEDKAYQEIAARTIGRWAGDRIAFVGDYAEDYDLSPEYRAESIYARCGDRMSDLNEAQRNDPERFNGFTEDDLYTDISTDVCAVIEHELDGRYEGNGWRDWKRSE